MSAPHSLDVVRNGVAPRSAPESISWVPSCHYETLEVNVSILNHSHVANRYWKDMTGELQEVLMRSGIHEGHLIVQSLHTTAGFVLNEAEEGLIAHDFPSALQRLCPEDSYAHDAEERLRALPAGEPQNGISHLQCMIGAHPSLALIVHQGQLCLGKWQQIVFFDFDPEYHHDRTFTVQVWGLRESLTSQE